MLDKTIFGPLLERGISEDKIQEMGQFLYKNILDNLYLTISEVVGESGMQKIEKLSQEEKLGPEETRLLLEEAYTQKTGRSLMQEGRSALAKCIEKISTLDGALGLIENKDWSGLNKLINGT